MNRTLVWTTLVSMLLACGGGDGGPTQTADSDMSLSDTQSTPSPGTEPDAASTPEDAGTDGIIPQPPAPTPEPSPGPRETSNCLNATSVVSHQEYSIDVNGVTRTYRLFVPATEAGQPLSLIMGFHGGGDAGLAFAQQDAFAELATQHGIINVYLDEMLFPGNEGGWVLNTGEGRMQDINFIEAVLARLSQDYCLDQRRMYAVGYSLGGMYSYEVACHLNHRFSGVVSVAGTMPVNPTSCEITDTIPILHVHGTDDAYIPYYDDWDWKNWEAVGTMRSVPSLIEHWAERYNCQTLENTINGSIQHVIRGDCDGGVRVEHYAWTGLNHGWPYEIEDQSFPDLIWEMMSPFSKP